MRRSNSWIALATIVVLCSAAPALAGGARYGTRVGMNLSTFNGDFDRLVGFRYQTGFTGGGVLELPGAGPVRVRTEMVYSRKGAEDSGSTIVDQSGNPVATTSSDHWQLDYLEVPLLASVRLPARGPARAYVLAGPSFGFALGGHFVGAIRGFDQRLSDLKAVDVGLAGGLGVEFATGGPSVGIEARFTQGLSDLYDIADNLSSINRVWTLSMTVMR